MTVSVAKFELRWRNLDLKLAELLAKFEPQMGLQTMAKIGGFDINGSLRFPSLNIRSNIVMPIWHYIYGKIRIFLDFQLQQSSKHLRNF